MAILQEILLKKTIEVKIPSNNLLQILKFFELFRWHQTKSRWLSDQCLFQNLQYDDDEII